MEIEHEESPLPRGIVIDTNAMGGGHFDLARLERFIETCSAHGVDVWVPEPVIWEWAEHAEDAYKQLVPTLRRVEGRLLAAGLTFDRMTPPEDVVGEITESVTEVGGHVIPLPPDVAREALKDQILQLPPGRKKGKVKTGAADSAWLRSVLGEVDHDTDRIWIVSNDGDVLAAFSEWGDHPARHFASIDEAKAALAASPDPAGDAKRIAGEAHLAIAAFFFEEVVSRFTDDMHDPVHHVDGSGIDLGAPVIAASQHWESVAESTGFAPVDSWSGLKAVSDLVGVAVRRVDTIAGLIEADVEFLGAVATEVVFVDHNGDAQTDHDERWDLPLKARLTFEYESDDDVLRVTAVSNDEGELEIGIREERRYHRLDTAIGETLDYVDYLTSGVLDVPQLVEDDRHEPVAVDTPSGRYSIELGDVDHRDGDTGEKEIVAYLDGVEQGRIVVDTDHSAWVGGSEGGWMEAPLRVIGFDARHRRLSSAAAAVTAPFWRAVARDADT